MRAAFVAALLLIAPVAHADEDSENKLRDVLRHMTVDLRAAQDNQATLQAQLDAANKQRDQFAAEVASLNAKLAAQTAAPAAAAPAAPTAPAPQAVPAREVAELRDALEAERKNAAQLQAGLSRWQSAYQQAASVAQSKDASGRQARAAAVSASGTLKVCADKNEQLIAVATDILHLYQSQDFKSILLRSYEPLVGLDRVKLENIVQDWEDRIRAQKYYAPDPGAAPSAAAPAAPPPPAAAPSK